jgi:O-antigen ligase
LASLALVILAQILIPVYIRLPIPGIAAFPPPLMLLMGIISITVVVQMLKPVKRVRSRYETNLSIALLVYGAVLFVSIPNGYMTPDSYAMFVKTVFIPTFLFFTVLSKVRSGDDLSLVFHVILVAATLCGLLAIHEYSVGDNIVAKNLAPEVTPEEDFFLWYLTQERSTELLPHATVYRVFSFFTQPLEYSAFMIMAFPFTALCFVSAKSLSQRLFYGFSTLVTFVGFAVSFSRGPTLALAIVIMFLAYYEKRVRPWIFVGAIGIAIGLISVWSKIAEKLTERITGSSNVTLRFRLWENGIQTFLENPIRGIGYGNYPNYHVESIRAHKIGPMYEYPWQHIERVTTMENVYITLAAETGILGLTAFFVLLAVYFKTFGKVMRYAPNEQTRILALSSFGGVLAFLLSGMTVANIIGYTIAVLFFGVYISAIAVLSRKVPDSGVSN